MVSCLFMLNLYKTDAYRNPLTQGAAMNPYKQLLKTFKKAHKKTSVETEVEPKLTAYEKNRYNAFN